VRELAVGPGSAARDFAALVPLRSARPHRCGKELRVKLLAFAAFAPLRQASAPRGKSALNIIIVERIFARDF
jgi:hypothetical protein